MNRFLVAIDGSTSAWKALDQAMEFAASIDAEIVVVHVTPVERIPAELKRFAGIEQVDLGDAAFAWRQKTMLEDKIMAEAGRRLREKGIRKFTSVVLEGDPARCILEAAKNHHVRMIFLGGRGLGDLQSLLLGSVAHKVVNLASCVCVVAR